MNTSKIADPSQLLAQIRAYQERIQDGRSGLETPAVAAGGGSAFTQDMVQAVRRSVDQVNALQSNANQMIRAYEAGADMPLTDVVLAMQKSSLAFEATLQVRNKVLKAYEDIMNLPL